jgi:hypothetical protein
MPSFFDRFKRKDKSIPSSKDASNKLRSLDNENYNPNIKYKEPSMPKNFKLADHEELPKYTKPKVPQYDDYQHQDDSFRRRPAPSTKKKPVKEVVPEPKIAMSRPSVPIHHLEKSSSEEHIRSLHEHLSDKRMST